MSIEQTVKVLNEAFQRDPVAIRSLLCFQVPVNEGIACHPTIVVRFCEKGWVMTILGLLNGFCDDGRRICTKWSDKPINETGEHEFLGFDIVESDDGVKYTLSEKT